MTFRFCLFVCGIRKENGFLFLSRSCWTQARIVSREMIHCKPCGREREKEKKSKNDKRATIRHFLYCLDVSERRQYRSLLFGLSCCFFKSHGTISWIKKRYQLGSREHSTITIAIGSPALSLRSPRLRAAKYNHRTFDILEVKRDETIAIEFLFPYCNTHNTRSPGRWYQYQRSILHQWSTAY